MGISKIKLSWIIFIIGLLPLAFINELLKSNDTVGWIRLGIALIYLIVLRFLGDFIAKQLQNKYS